MQISLYFGSLAGPCCSLLDPFCAFSLPSGSLSVPTWLPFALFSLTLVRFRFLVAPFWFPLASRVSLGIRLLPGTDFPLRGSYTASGFAPGIKGFPWHQGLPLASGSAWHRGLLHHFGLQLPGHRHEKTYSTFWLVSPAPPMFGLRFSWRHRA